MKIKPAKLKLDIGCGDNKKEGFLGIDKYQGVGVDRVVDLEREALPFRESSVDRIYASHFLEHVTNLFHVMEECWRVLKPDAIFQIVVPHYRSRIAYQDPTHVRFFTENTFRDYFGGSYLKNHYDNQRKCNFKQTFVSIHGQNFENLVLEVYLRAVK